MCVFHFEPPILAQLMMIINFNQLRQITAVLGTILQRCPDKEMSPTTHPQGWDGGWMRTRGVIRTRTARELRAGRSCVLIKG